MRGCKNQPVQHLLIGNPENRRVGLFQLALERYGLAPAHVLSYAELLRGTRTLEDALQLVVPAANSESGRVYLRIESPGENFEVEKRLIARGDGLVDERMHASKISSQAALRMRYDRGRILFPAQWFAGFSSLLSEFEVTLAGFPSVLLYNTPPEIACMFDKPKSHALMARADVPVPTTLPELESYDDLRECMKSRGWNRVFVKLASGSSASGVMAIYLGDKAARAVTSMETVGSGSRAKFYNNLKLRIYHREYEIRRAVDFLFRETAHVEQWLPKASLSGRVFDLRVVIINGQAQHVVVRTSSGPITNLHLGNRRGDVELLKAQMGLEKWQHVLATAELASQVFPESHYMGCDMLVTPGFRNPTVLEANAFGDLLPGVQVEGRSTHESELAARVGKAEEASNPHGQPGQSCN